MAERKSFLLRVDRDVLDAVQRWANDDLRSLNGQIEFLLRHALRDAGRMPNTKTDRATGRHTDSPADSSSDPQADRRDVDQPDALSSDE
ncbi:MAG TPA: hypothetical protein DGD08_03895 [Gemmatimonas aurantiaca]|uniref:Arc family DNA binding domain-containing protein n=2 Tax=Gemmatimonas aurantiaca TaxID=173480 RepID=C1ADR2_GEMAT|nr:hypothetical protein [Gemmatimonas aurantiaca]BAH40639.1 hypothetical protein GAU_3597 [Gemmatimonas aurantiaca T-27]HCT56336.1 hypothetical protein [Gemmatimonas aurantiaca]